MSEQRDNVKTLARVLRISSHSRQIVSRCSTKKLANPIVLGNVDKNLILLMTFIHISPFFSKQSKQVTGEHSPKFETLPVR